MKKRLKIKRGKAWRKEQIALIADLIRSYKTVGIAKVRGIRASQLQRLRRELRDNARLRVSKNSLIAISFKDSGIDEMTDYIEDQMALIFTNLGAFELYRLTEASKIPAPIKAGTIAPEDIVIEAGPTALKPGPVVGELQNLGIPAGIAGGKVEIKKRTVVVKEGERVTPEIAEILAKLGIYPVKEGLDLAAVYERESGVLFKPEVLCIEPSEYISELCEAAKRALSLATHLKYVYPTSFTIGELLREASIKSQALAFHIAYPTPQTIRPLLQKAHVAAMNLGLNACIYSRETIPYLMRKAQAEAEALAGRLGTGGG